MQTLAYIRTSTPKYCILESKEAGYHCICLLPSIWEADVGKFLEHKSLRLNRTTLSGNDTKDDWGEKGPT